MLSGARRPLEGVLRGVAPLLRRSRSSACPLDYGRREGQLLEQMPRGFHPCFGSQLWTFPNLATLSFASDGNTYNYTNVPPQIWATYAIPGLNGTVWNASIRAQMGPYIRTA